MTKWDEFLNREDIKREMEKIENFLNEEREKYDGIY